MNWSGDMLRYVYILFKNIINDIVEMFYVYNNKETFKNKENSYNNVMFKRAQ